MVSTLSPAEEAQLGQTIEMFEVITQSQPLDCQSLEILKEAYSKLGREQDVVGTSKRIAEAYVQMGQLSSAILEYETILQRFPDDPDVQTALREIESKANNLADDAVAAASATATDAPAHGQSTSHTATEGDAAVDDGREAMRKLFVDTKVISAGDFDLCWSSPDVSGGSHGIVEPFIQVLCNKGILPVEKSLKLLSDKARISFLPLTRYDIDIELARTFHAPVCRRWCILPFDRMSTSVLVATANPFNAEAARELALITPKRILWYLAPPEDIMKDLRKVFR